MPAVCDPCPECTRIGAGRYSAVNPRLAASSQTRPEKILLLPPQLFVAELSAGGVIQRQADWTREAGESLLAAVEAYFRESSLAETVRMPALSPADDAQVESHIGLYDRVAYALYVYGSGQAGGWEHKKTAWDYTLGEGLAFLHKVTGADAALIFTSTDNISDNSRRAAFAVGLLIGVHVPLGSVFHQCRPCRPENR